MSVFMLLYFTDKKTIFRFYNRFWEQNGYNILNTVNEQFDKIMILQMLIIWNNKMQVPEITQ